MYCQKNQFLITGESATDATNTPTSRVLLNTRGGGGGWSGFVVWGGGGGFGGGGGGGGGGLVRICSVRDAKDVLGV